MVWTVLNGLKSDLFYTTRDGNQWAAAQQIRTDLPNNNKPSMVVDPQGSVWVVWSGLDGDDDEIFYSVWKDGTWQAPGRIGVDNEVPDIFPVIDLAEDGSPWVRWSTFGDGAYIQVARKWNGSQWVAAEADDLTVQERTIDKTGETGFDFPDDMDAVKEISFHIRPSQ